MTWFDHVAAEAAKSLCLHDTRNPDGCSCAHGDEPCPGVADGCGCDNCFYGRHKLADELLYARSEMAKSEGLA